MIAEPNNNGANGHGNGGLGGNIRKAGTRDTRLLERAVRERWKIPDDKREAIVNRQVEIAVNSPKDREATSAAKCLATMEAQNIAVAMKALDKVVPDQHQHNHAIQQIQARLDEFRAIDDPDDRPDLGRALPGPNGNGRH